MALVAKIPTHYDFNRDLIYLSYLFQSVSY